MSTDKNIKLPDDVLALLTKQAENEGVSLDEAAAVAIRIGLEEGRWRRLLAAGRAYGRESGYTEEDVETIIKGFRNETRGK